jgi:hypothetical protein
MAFRPDQTGFHDYFDGRDIERNAREAIRVTYLVNLPMENVMKHTLIGTALAMTLFATPAFAQQQPGTGGGAGGESGSAATTDKSKGAPPTNPSAAAPAGQMGTTGTTGTGGGASSAAGTGGGKGGESGSSGATDKTPEQRGNPATPTR